MTTHQPLTAGLPLRPVDPDEVDQPFDRPPRLPPSVTVRVEYRQLGPGPESIEVQWDAGAHIPTAADICAVIRQLWDPPRAWSASSRTHPGEVAGS